MGIDSIESVLITGGTGTFGKAFARFLIELGGIDRICIFSRGEHAQAVMRADFGATDQDRLRWFIGDVRDRDRLRRAMEEIDLVVHAAALKRIEVGHYNPGEMVKTNILGALNVIEAAHDAQVGKVVALSTDKAYQPVSAYGQSKALAESMFLAADYARGTVGPHFAVVRYGNIAGSAGSVIPRWRELGSSVPLTDPCCTRFWMTIDQAVDLVWKTTQTMQGGELVVPELPAYRLDDLAAAMGLETHVTGLPKWEKKHECMADGNCSNTARRMSVDELREALQRV